MRSSLFCRLPKNHSKQVPALDQLIFVLLSSGTDPCSPSSSCAPVPWDDPVVSSLCPSSDFHPDNTCISVMLCDEQHQNLCQIVLVLSSCCTRTEAKGSAMVLVPPPPPPH